MKARTPETIGFISAVAIAAVGFGALAVFGGKSSKEAAPEQVIEKKAAQEQTLEQVQQQMAKQAMERKKSPEWTWAENGETEKVIAALKDRSLKDREARVHYIHALAQAIRPRPEWGPQFNDTKLAELIQFLGDLAGADRDEANPRENLMAIRQLAQWANAVPEIRTKVEGSLRKAYGSARRANVRSSVIGAWIEIRSKEAFPKIRVAIESDDSSLRIAATYALGRSLELGFQTQETAEILMKIAQSSKPERPLAIKLLAHHKRPEVEKAVSKLLRAKGELNELETEAISYALSQFQWEKLRAEFYRRAPSGSAPGSVQRKR